MDLQIRVPQNVITRPLELFILLVILCFISCPLFVHGNNIHSNYNPSIKIMVQFFSHYLFCVYSFYTFDTFKSWLRATDFWETLSAIFFTIRVFARRKSAEKYFFIFCFDVDVCHGVWIVDSYWVSQQTTNWSLY